MQNKPERYYVLTHLGLQSRFGDKLLRIKQFVHKRHCKGANRTVVTSQESNALHTSYSCVFLFIPVFLWILIKWF